VRVGLYYTCAVVLPCAANLCAREVYICIYIYIPIYICIYIYILIYIYTPVCERGVYMYIYICICQRKKKRMCAVIHTVSGSLFVARVPQGIHCVTQSI